MIKLILLCFSIIALNSYSFCQGSFYSNPLASSLYSNPANTALLANEKVIRSSILYKNQWPKIDNQMDSRYGEINSQLSSINFRNNKFKLAAGGYFNQNVQGIGKLKYTEVAGILSGFFLFDIKDGSFYFTGAIGGGLLSRSNDFSSYIFNDMIVRGVDVTGGASIDATSFNQTRQTKFDANAGVNIGYSKKSKFKEHKFLLGTGIYNITDKKILSLNNKNESISSRFNVMLLYDYFIKQSGKNVKNKLRFYGFYSSQGAYRQSDIGFIESFGLISNDKKRNSPYKILKDKVTFLDYSNFIDFGLTLRSITPYLNLIDFNVMYLAVKVGLTNTNSGISFGFSYDTQIRSSNKLPQGLGGIQEFYVTKKFNTKQKTKDNLPCPDF